MIVLPAALKSAEFLLPLLFFYPVHWWASVNESMQFATSFGFATQVIIVLLACEFFYYWFHRAAHEWSFLWRFHAVHHGAHRVYWMNAGRFHSIEGFLSGIVYFAPILFFVPDPEVVIMIISISSVTGFLEHINIDFEAGWLNYIFNSAQLHRWHHSKIVHESNKNYGKALVVWDLVFGTFYLPKDKHVGDVGIVEDDVPIGFAAQFRYPFKKK